MDAEPSTKVDASPPRSPRLPLNNAKHEAFAQARARGLEHRAAYVTAGYFPSKDRGARLQQRPDVSGRIAALAEQRRWSGTRNIAPVIEEMAELAKTMATKETAAAAVAAKGLFVEIARLKALLPADDGGKKKPRIETDLSDEEWLKRYGRPAP